MQMISLKFNPNLKTTFTLLPLSFLIATALHAETAQLDIIEVVDTNTGAKSKTNIVTTADVNKSTATDLKTLLKEEPSISFGGGNGTSQWLTIRGMGQDQVDLKVDNTYSDAQIFHHNGRFMMIDPSLIKRVDVQKGTGSASAGIGATSGSIVVTTVDAKDLLKDGRNAGFKLNTTYNSNAGWAKGGSIYGKWKNLDALVSGMWTDNRNYKDGNGQTITNSGLGQRALLAKLGVDINENQRIVLSHRQERYYGLRNLREEFDFALSNAASRNAPRYRITTQDTTNLQWIGKNMGFISQADVNAFYIDTARKEPADNSKVSIITKGANINLDSKIGENHLLKYGINYREETAKPATLASGVQHQKKVDSAAYIEGIWGISAFTLTTGLRYDHFKFTDMKGNNRSKGYFNPSVGLIWEATSDLSFNSSFNYATRSPRMYEAMLASGSRNTYTIDSNADAERSRNTEIGFNYNLSDNFSLNGSYFWQRIQDLQTYSNNIITNGGNLRNQGYELGAAYQIAGLRLRAGVAYSKPKLDGATYDTVVTAIPMGRTWTTSIAYKFETPSIELGWKGRFVESASYDTTTSNRGGGTTTTKRAGYGVNDFYVSWQPLGNETLNVNLALNNAFNKYYLSHSQRAGTATLPEAGRNVSLNINYTF